MSGRLQYGFRYRYPHMTEEESIIWERFLDRFPARYETVDYDFRVGIGATIPAGATESHARMITMLSQKRIDALCWIGGQPTIVEVKRRVGLGTVGQVMGYRTLFKVDLPFISEPKVFVVCETISDDDRKVLEAAGIPFDVV